MRRITPRTCLWPLVGCLSATFALSIGLTYRSDKHCYAGTCGEWLFPLQARLHVVIWYIWLSLSVVILSLRAFQPFLRKLIGKPLGWRVPLVDKEARISGLLLALWVCLLYGIIIGVWKVRLWTYFEERGEGLPGNDIIAAVALTGHFADVTMGMVLLPVSRHSALASLLKLSPSTTYTFHMFQAYVLFGLVAIHGSLYASWASLYNQNRVQFRHIMPVLNPTYLYDEVWPGNSSSLGIWRASLIFTGIASSLIMTAMFLTSFPIMRRKYFNLFYFTHLLGIVAVIVICLHASTMLYCTIPGLTMWVLDWSMRLFELRDQVNGQLKALGSGWYTLTIPLPRKRLKGCACHSPLAHFYIHHAKTSLREIHPFTTTTHLATEKSLASDETGSTIEVRFLFREISPRDSQGTSHPRRGERTQWTNKLGALADEEAAKHSVKHRSVLVGKGNQPLELEAKEELSGSYPQVDLRIRLEGPYFTAANPELHKTVICLVAGTGLSGALAIAAAFKAQSSATRPAAPCQPSSKAPEAGSACTVHSEGPGIWTRCVVAWSVRENEYTSMSFLEDTTCEGLEFRVHKTGRGRKRLDTRGLLAEICGGRASDAWVYISGPNGFITSAAEACSEVKDLTWFAARWD